MSRINVHNVVGILTFMSRINVMLSRVERKKFYNLGARQDTNQSAQRQRLSNG